MAEADVYLIPKPNFDKNSMANALITGKLSGEGYSKAVALQKEWASVKNIELIDSSLLRSYLKNYPQVLDTLIAHVKQYISLEDKISDFTSAMLQMAHYGMINPVDGEHPERTAREIILADEKAMRELFLQYKRTLDYLSSLKG